MQRQIYVHSAPTYMYVKQHQVGLLRQPSIKSLVKAKLHFEYIHIENQTFYGHALVYA